MRKPLALTSMLALLLAAAPATTTTAPATSPTTMRLAPPPTTETATIGAWTESEFGRRILRPFANAPYPHPSRADGFARPSAGIRYGPEHYQDSTVGLFVPKGYRAGDAVDYVVHLHGHGNHVSRVFEQFPLEAQVTKGNVNAILIVPQLPRDAGDSGGGKLELDDGAFAGLIDEVTRFLKSEGVLTTDRVGHVVLSTHSGGYKTTAGILSRGGLGDRVTDVLLFDSSYGNLDAFAAFVATHPAARLVSFHTRHLDDENVELKSLIEKAGGATRTLEESRFTDETAGGRGATFIATQLSHGGVLAERDYLARLLRTSGLEKR